MHLKRIELTNYRQHKRLDVDFCGNMIAVLGKNGSGKSNLIGAIQYALTGEQPGATKANLTTWGEKEGSVRLYFSAGPKNEEYVITRKTNGDVVMKVGGETIKQARKVEEALREKAGIDKELVRQIVFVPQKGIDSILFDDPKNREVAFQRLIGVGEASKVYDALRTEISQYDKPQGFDEAIDRSTRQLDEQKAAADACRESLKMYEDILKKLPTKESLQDDVDKLSRANGAIDEFVNVSKRLADAHEASRKALEKVASAGAVSDEFEAELVDEAAKVKKDADAVAKDIETGKDAIRYLTRLKELSDAAKNAKSELDAAIREYESVCEKYPAPIDEEDAAVKAKEAEIAALKSERSSLDKMVHEAKSNGTCPLCGAEATMEDIVKHVRDRMDDISSRLVAATSELAPLSEHVEKRRSEERRASSTVESKKNAHEYALNALKLAKGKNVDGVSIDLDTYKVSYFGNPPSKIKDIEAEVAEYNGRLAELNKRSSEISSRLAKIASDRNTFKSIKDEAARLSAQEDMLAQSKTDSEKRLSSIGIDPNEVSSGAEDGIGKKLESARKNLEAYNGIVRDMAAENARLESAEKTIDGTRKLIDELVEKRSADEAVRSKVDVLKRVRGWFHYSEGPRIRSQNVMNDLTACVNNFLGQFCAPFVVEAEEEGFGFRCRFIDGRTMPDPCPDASMLSGGQKVALAIAFRLAIYMCFGGELGLLSLDEPTAYLDDASIEHLGELLQKVGEVAKNKGLQILMATHEKAIMPYLDTKIDLGELCGKEA